jgi:hypothetical protein
MPYTLKELQAAFSPHHSIQDFKDAGLYKESSPTVVVGELSGGTIHRDLPSKLQERLDTPGLGKYKDASREDAHCLCALLGHGLSAKDAYATFVASHRGEDARERKAGHFEDYMARSVKAAVTYVRQKKQPSRTGEDGEVIVEHTHRMEAVQRKWFWKNYIPSGRITIIAGDPGEGLNCKRQQGRGSGKTGGKQGTACRTLRDHHSRGRHRGGHLTKTRDSRSKHD